MTKDESQARLGWPDLKQKSTTLEDKLHSATLLEEDSPWTLFYFRRPLDDSIGYPLSPHLISSRPNTECGARSAPRLFKKRRRNIRMSEEMHKLFSLPGRVSFALMFGSYSNNKISECASCSVCIHSLGAGGCLFLSGSLLTLFIASQSYLKVISLWEVTKAQWQTKALFKIQFLCFLSLTIELRNFSPRLFGEL